jgi:uncharacterized membrane protein YhaH (DUF805 family)
MTFVESVKTCFSKYANFEGRASRSEYWWFILFTSLITVGFEAVIDRNSFNKSSYQDTAEVMGIIVNLALFLPQIAVTTRRLHDVNKSGWWQLISFTIIGLIPLIVWLVTKGEKHYEDRGVNFSEKSTNQFNYSESFAVTSSPNSLNDNEKIIIAGFDTNGNVLRLSFYTSDPKLNNLGLILGRDSVNCDLYIADQSISRKHARIYKREHQIWIEDLGSTNGLIVNGKKINNGESALLSTTGSLSIGGIELTLGRG